MLMGMGSYDMIFLIKNYYYYKVGKTEIIMIIFIRSPILLLMIMEIIYLND
jgi:hypothetical protein